jgi:hypothetical protein
MNRYTAVVRNVIERVSKYGRAEVHWHPLANGPTVRTGLGRFKTERSFPDEYLIGIYTRAPHPAQIIDDIEAYKRTRT